MLQNSTAYINNNDYFFAFWLVLYYDLLEDRYIDVDSPWFKFDSCLILWTNHNSSLSIATNQFVSFYVDNRLRESAIFLSVKAAKFEIKCFFPHIYFNSILYKSNRFHVALHLFSNISQRTSKCGKNSGTQGRCSCHILTSSVIYYWNDAQQHKIDVLIKYCTFIIDLTITINICFSDHFINFFIS